MRNIQRTRREEAQPLCREADIAERKHALYRSIAEGNAHTDSEDRARKVWSGKHRVPW